MLLREHTDLKIAILAIPPKEKDKLLLRLIAKDKVLTEHLHFKLLEGEGDLFERQELLKKEIEVVFFNEGKKLMPKDILPAVRRLNGRVNLHYKVTKDVNTELELRIYLLNRIPLDFKEGIFSSSYKYNEKLMAYFLKTTMSVFHKYRKLHEDLQFDLKADFNILLNRIKECKLAYAAHELGLPKEV